MTTLPEMERARPFAADLLDGEMDAAARLLDLVPVGVYICDRDGLIVYYNRHAAELWGREPKLRHPDDRFCGSLRLHHPEGGELPHSESPMANAIRSGVPIRDQEVVVEQPDGSRHVASVSIEPIRDGRGKVMGAICCYRDVTERRRLQAALREQEQRWGELLKVLPIAVYTTDAQGRITFYNEAAAALWGTRPELGKSEWCGSWRLAWPDGTPMTHEECPMAVALKEDRSIRGAEAVAIRPDGTRVPFLAYPMPLHDQAGNVIGALNMLADISERKREDMDAYRLAAIVESSQDAIISKDLTGIIMSWNRSAERLFGYRAEEVIGKPIGTIIPPGREEEGLELLTRLRRGERIEHFETIRLRKDGSLIDVSLAISPIRDASGRIIGASKIARDITERRRAEEHYRMLMREMNHRIKNLFALASGIVAISARSAGSVKELASAVRERLGALARAHSLTLPPFTPGGQDGHQSTTLPDLVETILLPYRDMKGEARFEIRGPDVPIGPAALANFALLLHELATNAAKYGALSVPEGTVDIRWTAAGSQLMLSWQELGGPPVTSVVESTGFGSTLTRGAVEGQFGGSIAYDWNPAGLAVRVAIPLERLAA